MELIAEGEDIKAIPAIAEPNGINDADRAFDLLSSNSGEPLAPLETAEVIRRLINYGWTEAQIAQRRGWRSTQTVTNYLSMLEMPEKVKEHVRNGHVSATLAREISKDKGGDEADKVIRENLAERKAQGKKAKVTRKAISRTTERPQIEATPQGDASLIAALTPLVSQLSDLANAAFDAGEQVAPVPLELIQQIDSIMRQAGEV